MKHTLITSTACAALLTSSAMAATTFTYDIDSVGAINTQLSDDGWAGDDINNWIVASFSSNLYARNNNGGDNSIFRSNDGNFSYSIPASATSIILDIDARGGGATPFFQAGLSSGSDTILGIGANFNGNDKYFILDGSTRHFESGTSAASNDYRSLRVVFDLVSGTADLILDPDGANTLLIDDVALGTDATDLASTDGLFIRSNSQFVGPGEFRITVIPEPSTSALAALGFCGLLLRRRR